MQNSESGHVFGVQAYQECLLFTVFDQDMKPLTQTALSWEQVDTLRAGAFDAAPFDVINTPLTTTPHPTVQ